MDTQTVMIAANQSVNVGSLEKVITYFDSLPRFFS